MISEHIGSLREILEAEQAAARIQLFLLWDLYVGGEFPEAGLPPTALTQLQPGKTAQIHLTYTQLHGNIIK